MLERSQEKLEDLDRPTECAGQDCQKSSNWNQVSSLCPECLKIIPGVVRESPGGLVLDKVCPDHGSFVVQVSSDLKTYQAICEAPRKANKPSWFGSSVIRGCPDDCGLCPDHDQHTCLAILEITSRCDLHCPICLAKSSPRGSHLSLAAIESALEKVVAGGVPTYPLQLSGGEPTLHPDLVDIIGFAISLGFRKIEIDTNGLNLAKDQLLAQSLRNVGLTGIYLQMDSLSDTVSQLMRGRDLVEEKLRAIENCKRAGLQVVLSMTVVPGINDRQLWEMVRFGVDQSLTGVNFQGVAVSGRFPLSLAISPKRFTQGHFMHSLEAQSDGKLKASDLTPIPCPDTRCGLVAYALVKDGEILPLKRLWGNDKLLDFSARLSDWEDLIRSINSQDCFGKGCECGSDQPVSLRDLIPGSDYFSIGYHGMMDAYTFDLERARRCCVHRITTDGLLIPFCLYNIRYRNP